MKIKFIFAWYDLWVGAYWQKKKRRLYIMILPTLGVRIDVPHFWFRCHYCGCRVSAKRTTIYLTRNLKTLCEHCFKDPQIALDRRAKKIIESKWRLLVWKFRYARYFKRKCAVDWKMAWNDAGASAEDKNNLELTPIEAADDSIDAWASSQ